MSPADDDPPFIGNYAVVRRLGDGGMGRVYLCRSPGGRHVAVKVIRSDLADDDSFRRRFRDEVAAARRVHGIWTAAYVDADTEAVQPWLAVEYIRAPTLAEVVAEAGPVPVDRAIGLASGLAEALIAIHAAGVVHRDLTPKNILVAADGPRVIDFGISKTADGLPLTTTGVVIGTPGYLAPEQLEGRPASVKSDVHALGAVLRYAVGQAYPASDNPRFNALIEACLESDPSRRPDPQEILAQANALSQNHGSPGSGPAAAGEQVTVRQTREPLPPTRRAPPSAGSRPRFVLTKTRYFRRPIAPKSVGTVADGSQFFVAGGAELAFVSPALRFTSLAYTGSQARVATPQGGRSFYIATASGFLQAKVAWKPRWRKAIRVGDDPSSVAVMPGGDVIVANRASKTLSVVEGGRRLVDTLWLQVVPEVVTPLADDTRVSVLTGSGTAHVVDVRTGDTVSQAHLPGPPGATAHDRPGHLLYVAHPQLNCISVLDTEGNRVLRSMTCRAPRDVAISRDGAWLFVLHDEGETLDVYDSATGTPVNRTPLDGRLRMVTTLNSGVVIVVAQDRTHALRTVGVKPGPVRAGDRRGWRVPPGLPGTWWWESLTWLSDERRSLSPYRSGDVERIWRLRGLVLRSSGWALAIGLLIGVLVAVR